MLITTLETPLGPATAAASEQGALTGFWFIGQQYYPKQAAAWTVSPDAQSFAALRKWLDAYFAGKNPAIDFPLAPQGTPFRQAIWEMLLAIPYGQLTTYGALAKAYAGRAGLASMSAQAVGGAVGHNPISVLIPCHRVVGTDGTLTGYAGGVGKKTALLRLEGVQL